MYDIFIFFAIKIKIFLEKYWTLGYILSNKKPPNDLRGFIYFIFQYEFNYLLFCICPIYPKFGIFECNTNFLEVSTNGIYFVILFVGFSFLIIFK
jgi:hypothetical protein